jgi:hypothetical protein
MIWIGLHHSLTLILKKPLDLVALTINRYFTTLLWGFSLLLPMRPHLPLLSLLLMLALPLRLKCLGPTLLVPPISITVLLLVVNLAASKLVSTCFLLAFL